MDENKLEESKSENNTETIFTEADFNMSGYDKHIRHARNACFISAGLLFINALILFSKYPFDMTIFFYITYFGLYILAALFFVVFYKNKTYTAIIIALCVFALFIIVNAIINPAAFLAE